VGTARHILLLDDDADLRDAVGDLIRLLGAACLALPSVNAMNAAERDVLACQLAIIDVNLGEGEPSGVDAYEWLRRHAFGGEIVFLTGHAPSHPAVSRAASLGARVLAKPIETDELRALVNGAERR
jgi:DNA-binding response OmpR family regulator